VAAQGEKSSETSSGLEIRTLPTEADDNTPIGKRGKETALPIQDTGARKEKEKSALSASSLFKRRLEALNEIIPPLDVLLSAIYTPPSPLPPYFEGNWRYML
jgi:hypothetical protein